LVTGCEKTEKGEFGLQNSKTWVESFDCNSGKKKETHREMEGGREKLHSRTEATSTSGLADKD